MLTVDLLKKNDILKDLTPEQLAAIQTLSQNDESAIIAKKTREIYDFVDTEVEKASGLKKETSEKTSAFAARAITEMKKGGEGAKKLQEQIDSLKTEKSNLEKQLKEGKGDEALKTKVSELETTIADKEKRITDLEGQVTSTKADWEKKLNEANEKNTELALDFHFSKAKEGLKFLEHLPEAAVNATWNSIKQSVLAKGTPEFFDNNGVQDVRFRGKDGHPIANPENLQKPFTLSELSKLEAEKTGILDKGKNQGGAGTKGKGSGGNGGSIVNISGAKTKKEATEAIKQGLLSKGISTSHPDYQKQYNEIYDENKVGDLPLR